MTFVNCPTGQPLSIKVKILHLQWAAPQISMGDYLQYQYSLPKKRAKVNIGNNPIIHYIVNFMNYVCKLSPFNICKLY